MKVKKASILLAIVVLFSQINITYAHNTTNNNHQKDSYPILRKYLEGKKRYSVKLDSNSKKLQNRTTRVIVKFEKGKENIAKKQLKKIPGIKVKYEYKTLINGVSIDLPNDYLDTLYNIEGIQDIKESEKIVKQMYNAKEITKIIEAKAKYSKKYGLDGRGMVIATLDSGVDINHPDMRIDKEAESSMKIKNIKPPFTNKVPFGFNYFKGDSSDLKDNVSKPHGMHIAGILAGNSSRKDGFKGIAPNAQLLVYKVITDDKKSSKEDPDIEYIGEDAEYHAMEDAVARGADVISLSIGAFGSGKEDDIWNDVVENAYKQGVIVVAAVGNRSAANSNSSYENFADAKFDRKDTSTGVSVAMNRNSIAVGSTRNTGVRLPSVNIDGEKYYYSNISRFNDKDGELNGEKIKKLIPSNMIKEKFIYVDKGLKNEDDKLPVKGKIVVARRGGEDIKVKANKFLKKGAKGFILINGATDTSNVDTLDQPILGFNHLSIKDGWAISISQNSGEKLLEKIKENNEKSISFNSKTEMVKFLNGNLISGFSGWGPNYDLEIKPDLVAPGENITSTGNGSGYVTMSGTSMASPHIAGISTLLLEKSKKIKSDNNLNINLVDLTKIMMMNTSTILDDYNAKNGNDFLPYSPRVQGAGLVNLENALDSDVLVTYKENKGSISLKEIGNKTKFQLKLTNISDKKHSFNVESTDMLTQGYTEKDKIKINTEKLSPETKLKGDSFVTINPRSSVIVDFELDTTLNKKDSFVEGYLKFLPADSSSQPILSIPFMGYKGDWNKENILDKPQWENDSLTKLVKLHKFVKFNDHEGEYEFEQLGKKKSGTDIDDQDTYTINSLRDGIQDFKTEVKKVAPSIVFLRETKDYDVSIVKEKSTDAKALRVIEKGHYPEKFVLNAYNESNKAYKNKFKEANTDAIWDGGIYDPQKSSIAESDWFKAADEGEYYIRIRARRSKDKPWEAIYMKIRVDNTEPKLKTTLSKDKKHAIVEASDNNSIEYIGAQADNKELSLHKISNEKYSVDLSGQDYKKLRVEAMDYAGNPTSNTVNIDNAVTNKADDITDNKNVDIENLNEENDSDEFDPNDIDIPNGVMIDHGIALKKDYMDIDNPDDIRFKYTIYGLKEGLTATVTNINTNFNRVNNEILENSYKPLDSQVLQGDNDDAEGDIRVAEGDNYINVKVVDKQGRLLYNHKFTLFMDLHSPVGIFSDNISLKPLEYDDGVDPSEGNTQYGKIYVNSDKGNISGSAYDNLDKYKIKINGDIVDRAGLAGHFGRKYNETNFSYDFKAVEGDYLHVMLEDIYGNNRKYELKIVKDTQKPIITVENEKELNSDSALNYKVDDNIKDENKENVSVVTTINGKNYLDGKKLKEYDIQGHEGNYLIKIVAKDLAGNISTYERKIEKEAGILTKGIRKYDILPLNVNKEEFISLLKDGSKFFDLDDGVRVSITETNIVGKKASFNAEFINQFGFSIKNNYEIDIKDSDGQNLELDKNLDRNLLKDKFTLGEKNIYSKLFNTDDGATLIVRDKIDTSKEGNVNFRVRFEKDGKYFEKDFSILVVKKEENQSGSTISNGSSGKKENISEKTDEKKDIYKFNQIEDILKKQNNMERVYGRDRISTSIEISKKMYKNANTVILVSQYALSDALTSGLLSSQKQAPILLTNKEKLNSRVKSELKRLKARNVILVGGKNSLDRNINFELKNLGLNVTRVDGKDRFETSVKVYNMLEQKKYTGLFIANGYSGVDAISVSPVSIKDEMPLILTNGEELSESLKSKIKGNNIVVIGGENSINEKLRKEFNAKRIGGKDRYETSFMISNQYFNNRKKIILGSGENFVDCLVGAPYAGKIESPIVLTKKDSVTYDIYKLIEESEKIIILGGTDSIK